MEGETRPILRQKLADSLAAPVPVLTVRDIRLPKVPGKAIAVIGMRRSGKTCFLWQCLKGLIETGTPREALLYLNFEDDRLEGIGTDDLSFVVEEYFKMYPAFRDQTPVTLFLDEIQLVPGWEVFARRILDSERVRLFISGSSATMLSREVATSMRGRAMEVTVFPFSFREALAHQGLLPAKPWSRLPKAQRSGLAHAFLKYLHEGGFPEAQGIGARDRHALLRGYVDVAVLRDVIERHAIANPVALRWLQRHLLGNPAAPFSVQKFYDALKSQGISISKDSLHAFLAHFEDAFLIRNTSLLTNSERQRMVNPRKAYPIDCGLIAVCERSARLNLGHALETAVLIELQRRGFEVHYLRTPRGNEVDFHASDALGNTLLIQVCADASHAPTRERETRSLVEAAALHPRSRALLLVLDPLPTAVVMPEPVVCQSAIEWFLEESAPDLD